MCLCVCVYIIHLQSLLEAAHLFKLPQMLEDVSTFLESHLDVNNCFRSQRAAQKYNCRKLLLKTKQFVGQNARSAIILQNIVVLLFLAYFVSVF